MLVLSRKAGEKIMIGDRIEVTVNRVSGNRVTLGISAPHDVHIVRAEIESIVNAFRDRPASTKGGGPAIPADDHSPLICASPVVM